MKARENPFRVDRVHALPFEFENDSFNLFYSRLKAAHFRGAIIGPHGTGKTTLLNELQNQLQQAGIPYKALRLMDDGRDSNKVRIQEWLDSSSKEMVLILDGAGLLNFWDWQRVKRKTKRFAGLLITAHKPGRLPTLIELQPSVKTLIRLVRNLEIKQSIPDDRLHELFQTCNGNLRDCLRKLYDQYAEGTGEK
ncbi:AAA family ATPase [Thalassoglobus polymorphus]|uniref:AAA+ ATPase domain-containing protein n=1 Tax=Thalassoglobus polymorphus TaxID=2527994 RepID=A0A517QJ92_9PLAN|nr:AAA family ATPase [Thalassoglobus polymorphus]QDT31719.1 hypothetical protein Mal48_09540 [Thalassoglobus polymorphus]